MLGRGPQRGCVAQRSCAGPVPGVCFLFAEKFGKKWRKEIRKRAFSFELPPVAGKGLQNPIPPSAARG